MPKVFTNSAAEVLNAIRNSATVNYQNYVPFAQPDGDSVREIGAIIMDMPELQNEFLQALINRIGRVIITSKMYENPWAFFIKGKFEFGMTVAEYFVNLAKPYSYDPSTAATNFMEREIPDVRSSFHVMNYQKYYKQTIQESDLEAAFLTYDGLTNFIMQLTVSLITSANTDELMMMKYLLAVEIYNGRLTPISIPVPSKDNAQDIVTEIKSLSNKMTFQSTNYNMAGVTNHVLKENQYLILSADFDASMDVNVLATSFNMERAEFMGHRVLIDSFGALDIERLGELIGDEPGYIEFGAPELEALDAIPGVLVDKDFFQIYNRKFELRAMRNDEGLYRNAWLHVWKIYAVSPFANQAVLIPATPTVTGVTVAPSAVTADPGQSVQLSATVTTENFAPQEVTWQSSNENVTVSPAGVVSLNDSASGTVTITATSVYDTEKKGTATITVA